MEGFLRYDFGGLIHGGAYFRNFMELEMKLCIYFKDFYSIKQTFITISTLQFWVRNLV